MPPELAGWPKYVGLETLAAGAAARQDNVSEIWAWLGSYDVARPYAADLFGPAHLTAMPIGYEHNAAELNALLETMSFWSRLSGEQRMARVTGIGALSDRLGRPIRSSSAACLVTARRAS